MFLLDSKHIEESQACTQGVLLCLQTTSHTNSWLVVYNNHVILPLTLFKIHFSVLRLSITLGTELVGQLGFCEIYHSWLPSSRAGLTTCGSP